MPGTAASLEVRDAFDPRENILAGCRYFRWLVDYFQGNVPLALAGYNAGYNRVISAGCQVPAIKETQEFVTQVMGLYCLLNMLLVSSPAGLSHGNQPLSVSILRTSAQGDAPETRQGPEKRL